MAIVVRILGVSLMTGFLAAGFGYVVTQVVSQGAAPALVYILPVFFLACLGGVIGAIAGAAREIVNTRGRKGADWSE